MNIAILGATGCVGRHLIGTLLEYPDNVVTGSYIFEKEIPQNIPLESLTWKQVNLLDRDTAQKVF